MLIELTNKEITDARRLERCLASDMVPVKELRSFFSGLGQKIDKSDARPDEKRRPVKHDRKNKYKLKVA